VTTSFRDPEKARLQAYVQQGDRDLDPSQGDAWAAEGTFQIAEFPVVTGPSAIKSFLEFFFEQKMFKTLSHEIVNLVELPDEVSFQANAIYTLQNGETLRVPYANFITYTREGGALKFQSYRVYINTEPLMKRALEIHRSAEASG
jgi:hypothetical protein